MEIRKIQDSDRDKLSKIYLESRRETFHWMPKEDFKFTDFTKDTEGEEIHVAIENGQILGFISVWLPDLFIHHLYVDSKHQGAGVGKTLLHFVLNSLSRPVGLKCVVQNKRAVEFYKSQGWEIKETGSDVMGPYYFFEYKK